MTKFQVGRTLGINSLSLTKMLFGGTLHTLRVSPAKD